MKSTLLSITGSYRAISVLNVVLLRSIKGCLRFFWELPRVFHLSEHLHFIFFRWKVFQVCFHGISGTFHFKNVKTGKLTEEGRLILWLNPPLCREIISIWQKCNNEETGRVSGRLEVRGTEVYFCLQTINWRSIDNNPRTSN